MPELPEVQALVDFLDVRLPGLAVADVEVGSVAVLKTYDPPPQALAGSIVDSVSRHGKFLDVDVDGLHLVFHLARAGWLRWSDALAATRIRPGKSPIALRVRMSDGSGFDLTEAGTKKGLAVYLVADPAEVPGVAALGPDPLALTFTREVFGSLLAGRSKQIKGLLRDQSVIAGIGNVYRAELLFLCGIRPDRPSDSITDDEFDELWRRTVELMRIGTRLGRIVTTDPEEIGRPRGRMDADERLYVYHREHCRRCGSDIATMDLAGRPIWYCSTCQP